MTIISDDAQIMSRLWSLGFEKTWFQYLGTESPRKKSHFWSSRYRLATKKKSLSWYRLYEKNILRKIFFRFGFYEKYFFYFGELVRILRKINFLFRWVGTAKKYFLELGLNWNLELYPLVGVALYFVVIDNVWCSHASKRSQTPYKVVLRFKRRFSAFQNTKKFEDPSSTARAVLILVRRQQQKVVRLFWSATASANVNP